MLGMEATAMQTALQTALTNVQTDITGYIGIVLPVALAIVGTFFGIKKAVQFFRSVSGRA